MPFCPNCKYEYRPEFAKCADCGAELVDSLPDESATQLNTEQWVDLVCIATFAYDSDAQAACATLRAQGIDAAVHNSVMSQADAFIVFADGGLKLMIPKEDAERALVMLEEQS